MILIEAPDSEFISWLKVRQTDSSGLTVKVSSLIPKRMSRYVIIRHPVYSQIEAEGMIGYRTIYEKLGMTWSCSANWLAAEHFARKLPGGIDSCKLFSEVYPPDDDFLDQRAFEDCFGNFFANLKGTQVFLGYEANAYVNYRTIMYSHVLMGSAPVPPSIGIVPSLIVAPDSSWCFRTPFGLYVSIFAGSGEIIDSILASCRYHDLEELSHDDYIVASS